MAARELQMSDETTGQQVRSDDLLGVTADANGFVSLDDLIAAMKAQDGEAGKELWEDAEREVKLLAMVELQRMEIERLREALALAVESDGGTRYEDLEDDCGTRCCCLVRSYEPHTEECWVTAAQAALTPNAGIERLDGREGATDER